MGRFLADQSGSCAGSQAAAGLLGVRRGLPGTDPTAWTNAIWRVRIDIVETESADSPGLIRGYFSVVCLPATVRADAFLRWPRSVETLDVAGNSFALVLVAA